MIGGGDAADETQEIISFDRTDALSIDELGLTLEEAKSALVALQIAITDAQVDDLFERSALATCGCTENWGLNKMWWLAPILFRP